MKRTSVSGWIGRLSETQWLMALGTLALMVRLLWALVMADRVPQLDEVQYIEHAVRLARGEGYVDGAGNPTAFWPVGYPALLSLAYRLFGESKATGIGLQIVIGVATCLLLSVAGTRLFHREIGRWAGLLLAVYPNHVMYATLHLGEPLFTLLLLAALIPVVSRSDPGLLRSITAGMLFGLATLTRPLIFLFPLLLPLAWSKEDRRTGSAIRTGAVVFAATMLTVSPWLWRNHGLTGRWTTLSTNGGDVFWVGNNPRALGGYRHPQDLREPLRVGDHFVRERGYRLGLESIVEAPGRSMLRAMQKITYLFAIETDGSLWNLKGLTQPRPILVTLLLLALANVAYLLVLSSGLLGLMDSSASPLFRRIFLLLVAYTIAIVMVFFGDPRYHLPLIPPLLLFSAQGALDKAPRLWRSVRAGESSVRRPLSAWGALMVMLISMMLLNLGLKWLETIVYGNDLWG
jgi:4-amino-4-deoxy-L-arabinose transferase-like glycosyltransferase